MRAIFEDIGPIEVAELELGGLTVIAGQNNTGKTYLVYTLYSFLRELPARLFFLAMHRQNWGHTEIEKLARELREKRKASMELDEFKEVALLLIQSASASFSDEVCHAFSSTKGGFDEAFFELQVDYQNLEIKAAEIGIRKEKDDRLIKASPKDNKVVFELEHPGSFQPSLEFLMGKIAHLFLKTTQVADLKPFLVSAERFGISLFYKELASTEDRLVEELQKLSDEKQFDPFRFLDKEIARYAKPIRHNIDFTSDLPRVQRKKSTLPADKQHSVSNMMDGNYKASSTEIRFVSKRRGDKRFDIPLHLASASARGVSDLYFYLKHVAAPGQLLIIDEPESHLSPTNQILMARLLAFCVNSGLKVLITTHSDYLVKEINNLIMLNGDFDGKNAFLEKHKQDYSENDYLHPESVKAYTCEEGTLKSCEVDAIGIDMPVFDEAIDKINQISNQLAHSRSPSDS